MVSYHLEGKHRFINYLIDVQKVWLATIWKVSTGAARVPRRVRAVWLATIWKVSTGFVRNIPFARLVWLATIWKVAREED